MTMTKSIYGVVRAGLMSGAALVALSGAALAADLGKSYKDGPMAEPEPDYKISVNGGLTTDYVFRGISQSDENFSVFAGSELTYKWFYIGFWAASVDEFASEGDIEIDLFAGVRKSWNGIDIDVGVLYYAYPENNFTDDPEYVEIKAGISGKVWGDITAGATVYYSPDYNLESGATWTFEGKLAKALPFWGLSLSGVLGHVTSDDDGGRFSGVYGDDAYTYWNVGLSKTFKEHFTVDVRYWGTDIEDGPIGGADDLGYSDDRVVGTLTFTY